MNKLMEHWFSYAMIVVWLVMCVICQKTDLASGLANKGLSVYGGEYYRFITTLFLHNNFLHMLVNASALYFVGEYLEPQINPAKLLIFSLLIGVATEILFATICKNAVSMGGSPIVFALIGLIIALQIMKTDANKFQLGTWYGNWIIGYAVLANIPVFSTSFTSTLIIHGLPLILGILMGCLGVGLKLL